MSKHTPEGKPKHVAFFLPDMTGGGAEKAVYTIANAMITDGTSVDIVLAQAKGEFLPLITPPIRVVDLGAPSLRNSIRPLAKYLREVRPDIIFSQMFDLALYAAAARRLSGQKPILSSTIHSTLSLQAKEAEDWSLKGIHRKIVRKLSTAVHKWDVDSIVAVSHGVATDLTHFARIPTNKINVIYNPINITEIETKATEAIKHPWVGAGKAPLILAVGKLKKAKAYDVLIDAFSIVRGQRECKLLILGEGEERQSLEDRIAAHRLTEDVQLLGFLPNPYPFMSACDVFALSSRREGFGIVLAEALALGKSVVSTDCDSGPREILQNGRYGRLVPVDDERRFAQALIEALN